LVFGATGASSSTTLASSAAGELPVNEASAFLVVAGLFRGRGATTASSPSSLVDVATSIVAALAFALLAERAGGAGAALTAAAAAVP